MILILYAFGGWNEMAYVAAEVRNPHKNIPRALVLGTLLVTAIYLAVTLAFVHGLGFVAMGKSEAVAAQLLGATWTLGRPADQRAHLHLGAGCDQRNDLHRRPHHLRHGR